MKRSFDLTGSAVGLVLLAPLLVPIACSIWVSMGRPILFRQRRPGLNGVPFTLLKFRTMREPNALDGKPSPDAERLTRLGRFLRATSLDELPELWNVLRGEMSLVGPRPLLMEYLPLYTEEQARRHEVRPGITGWAQVNGRNTLTWEEKFRMDVWYADNWSFWLDLRVLGRTLVQVLKCDGISQEGHATARPFQGREVGKGERS